MKNIMREAASDAVGISIIGNPYCYISLGTFTQSSRLYLYILNYAYK